MLKDNFKINTKYLIVIVIFSVLHFLGALRPVESVVTRVINPVLNSFYGLGSSIREILDEDQQRDDLLLENAQIRDELKVLTESVANLKILEDENRSLREHLNFLKNTGNKYVLSNVVSQGEINTNNDLIESFVLDKGSRDGLAPGLAVVSGMGAVIGKIVSVKNDTSIAYLVNNNKCRLAATIYGEDKTNGIIQGELGLTTKMKFIPLLKKIKIDDLVVTSGLEANIPKGLVVGKVSVVNKENNGIWQEAIVTPLDSIEYLSVVSVIIN